MNACDNVRGLSQEQGIHGRLLYKWRERLEEGNSASLHSRELILRKEIIRLKRLLANKTTEIDFFRHALQRAGARRQLSAASDTKASMGRHRTGS
jgi:transposase-like protein